jgi:hypothetical protein
MLGLAAIALRGGREQEAQSLYKSVLEADPKNPGAIAALSTLPAGASADGDTGNETRLKNLCANSRALRNCISRSACNMSRGTLAGGAAGSL